MKVNFKFLDYIFISLAIILIIVQPVFFNTLTSLNWLGILFLLIAILHVLRSNQISIDDSMKNQESSKLDVLNKIEKLITNSKPLTRRIDDINSRIIENNTIFTEDFKNQFINLEEKLIIVKNSIQKTYANAQVQYFTHIDKKHFEVIKEVVDQFNALDIKLEQLDESIISKTTSLSNLSQLELSNKHNVLIESIVNSKESIIESFNMLHIESNNLISELNVNSKREMSYLQENLSLNNKTILENIANQSAILSQLIASSFVNHQNVLENKFSESRNHSDDLRSNLIDHILSLETFIENIYNTTSSIIIDKIINEINFQVSGLRENQENNNILNLEWNETINKNLDKFSQANIEHLNEIKMANKSILSFTSNSLKSKVFNKYISKLRNDIIKVEKRTISIIKSGSKKLKSKEIHNTELLTNIYKTVNNNTIENSIQEFQKKLIKFVEGQISSLAKNQHNTSSQIYQSIQTLVNDSNHLLSNSKLFDSKFDELADVVNSFSNLFSQHHELLPEISEYAQSTNKMLTEIDPKISILNKLQKDSSNLITHSFQELVHDIKQQLANGKFFSSKFDELFKQNSLIYEYSRMSYNSLPDIKEHTLTSKDLLDRLRSNTTDVVYKVDDIIGMLKRANISEITNLNDELRDEIIEFTNSLNKVIEVKQMTPIFDQEDLLDKFKLNIEQSYQTIYKQMESLLSLNKTLDSDKPLPPLEGWSISPDLAIYLVELILELKPKCIVSLGSGSSDIIIGLALKNLKHGKLYSVEHEEKYYNKTKSQIESYGLEDYVSILLKPLKNCSVDGKDISWYDYMPNGDLEFIDILLVDGPPANLQKLSRYPAVPILRKRLRNGSIIILDDGKREDEKIIAEEWTKRYNLNLEYIDNKKGAFKFIVK